MRAGPVRVAGLNGVRAAIFDFNGTITDDEVLQYEIYAELAAELLGVELTLADYLSELAGRSDPAIVDALLERAHAVDAADAAARERLLAERLRRYRDRIAGAPPVRSGTAALIEALAASRVPLAVATGALRSEVEAVLSAAGLADAFAAIVSIEDVGRGKPDPESFLRAYDLLKASTESPLEPADVVVFEDSPFGIAAARSAGMRCVAAHLTSEPAHPPDAVLDALGPELLSTNQARRPPPTP
ncbi:HAD family phosphatase [Actinomadura barringtoniae]|uniref:HAD family phosphatase n=1 Tax=Actinomadura barringtoniae TaxID=1427535 RepID=A0A939P8Y7_9ACTN|nr:HAD family phosphatase [Actinomadura barringtoniae]MBO2448005.1 HAD family phosphatase [Actinomadura barringtoniae]